MMDGLGVFVCSGCDIGASIKLDGLDALAKEHGAATYACRDCLCSPDAVAELRQKVGSGEVSRLVLAACSPRAKTDEFRLDPTKVVVERVSLREQVAWSQPPLEGNTQMLAEDLLRMGLARAAKMNLPKALGESLERAVLVVGGGLAGLQAALASAKLGHPVVLVESKQSLGGHLALVRDVAPDCPPYTELHPNKIEALVREVEANASIRVFLGARIKEITGQPGKFAVSIETSAGAVETQKVGAIVQATGARPYDAQRLSQLGYGRSPNVVTSRDLEAMLLEGKLRRPSNGSPPKRVVFVQCAGSRDAAHLPYCSSECCATTLKQVAAIHRDSPETDCVVVFRDLRAPGQLEHFYRAVQEQRKSLFVRGVAETLVEGDRVVVKVTETLVGEDVTIDADLVVLAVGMVPNSADGEAIRALTDARMRVARNESEAQVRQANEIVEKLKHHDHTEILNLGYRQGPDLPVLGYGFPDSHYICFPYETRRTGIYAAGTVRAPMDAAQAVEDGWGAAMKAVQCIRAAERGEAVHPRAGDIGIADFFLQRCTQCKRCTEECPFGAINEDEKGTPQYNQLRCRRCGICMGACPERIVSFPDYSVDAVASMIKAIQVPEEDEEKPRILALRCENDALPALDDVARARVKWNPWIRIIPVRCLGAVNIVWIADALSGGIDGVLLVGCKSGNDYQCHYIKGSELAGTRMKNVQETLGRLALESERVQIVELARNEFWRIPKVFDEFADTIAKFGANPYKGF
jgi:quinone-modifying oxidoreductase subunit QmoB